MAFENIDFSSFGKNQNSSRPRSGEKKTYLDESVRTAFVRKNKSAEFRVSGKMLQVRAAYVQGPERRSRAGNVYTPSKLIPCVGRLPGFDGRCMVEENVKDARISTQYLFEVFDFRWYHKLLTERENYDILKHVQCNSRGPLPNGDACEYCDVEADRILGGWRVLGLSSARAQLLMQHDTHIMQFPLSDNPVEFFGQKLQGLSASCKQCGHEVFSERRLQMLSPDQVVTEIVRKKHTCPECGNVDFLQEECVVRNSSGEVVKAERGDITCKNIEVKLQPAKKGNTYLFNSDLLPFEDLKTSLKRLGIPEEASKEALERDYKWEVASAPYGIDPASFEDREKYIEVITNKQAQDLNNLFYGYKREDHRINNPWFQRESSGFRNS